LLQVGETVQLADTFLLTIRYPTEAANPPSIKNLPPVLKNSFLFISLSSIHPAVHGLPAFQFTGVDAPFILFAHIPWDKSHGYQHFTPMELFFISFFVALCVFSVLSVVKIRDTVSTKIISFQKHV
jgi:hypothetical protein